jgi:hypothetical protein
MKSSTRKSLFVLLLLYTLVLLSACFWPFNFMPANSVTGSEEGLVFSEPGIAYTEGGARLEGLTEFTLLAELSPLADGQTSWILCNGLDFDALNFLVGLYVDQLVVETQRGEQRLRASIKGGIRSGKRTWLVITGAPGQLRVYVDGRLVREINREQPDSTSWDAAYPLVIGARSDGKYPWQGVLHHLAILDTAAPIGAVQAPESLMVSNPVVSFVLSDGPASTIANQGRGDTGPLVVPERFRPYRRSTLMDIDDLWAPQPIWSDIVLNVVGFIPVGILLTVLLRRGFHPIVVLLLVLITAFGLSLCIEMLQAYLPRRWSTFTDVATNSLGALLGGSIWFIGGGRTGRGSDRGRDRPGSST